MAHLIGLSITALRDMTYNRAPQSQVLLTLSNMNSGEIYHHASLADDRTVIDTALDMGLLLPRPSDHHCQTLNQPVNPQQAWLEMSVSGTTGIVRLWARTLNRKGPSFFEVPISSEAMLHTVRDLSSYLQHSFRNLTRGGAITPTDRLFSALNILQCAEIMLSSPHYIKPDSVPSPFPKGKKLDKKAPLRAPPPWQLLLPYTTSAP